MEQPKQDRALRMLALMLQRTRRYSASQLAEQLGIDRRTVYRYINTFNEAGYVVLAVEQVEGSLKLGEFQFDPSRRYALVMGNEVKGVRQDVVDAADQALEIPQYGTKHSMNVSVTAGIVMWEAERQLGGNLH